VKGIGRWTAQMFLMFRLGRPNVLPDLDLGVRKAIQQVYNLRRLPTPEEVRERGAAWSPYASFAAWYLWRSLELPGGAARRARPAGGVKGKKRPSATRGASRGQTKASGRSRSGSSRPGASARGRATGARPAGKKAPRTTKRATSRSPKRRATRRPGKGKK
jgi:hypothetical protein